MTTVAHSTRAWPFLGASPGAGGRLRPGRAAARALLPVGLLLLASATSAQQTSEEEKPEAPAVRLPEISVTGPARLPEALPRSWVPNSVDIVPGVEIGRTQPTELPELLRRLPGVTLQDEQGSPRQPDLTLRGFTVSPVSGVPQGISVFLDGVRLNEPTVEEVNFDLIPLGDIDRVEVIRGASVLFGRNTLGGAINLITRRGQEVFELTPEVSAGSFGRRDYTLRLGGARRPFDYSLSLGESLEDGWRDFSASRVSHVFGKLGFRLGGTDVTLSYQYSDDRIHQAGSLPERLLRVDRSLNFTPGDFFAPGLHLAILNARQPLGEHWTLDLNAFVRALRSEQFNVNQLAANSRLFNDVLSTGGTFQATHRATFGGHDNVLIVGAEYTHQDVGSRTFLETDGLRTLQADLGDTQHAVGAFVQDSVILARDLLVRGSTVVLTLAGRWDWLQHTIDDRLGGPSAGVDAFQRFNPRAGLNVNLSDRVGFYGSYSENFRAPAFLELTCAGPGAVCPGLQVGTAPDPTLRPVVARTWEVGARTRPLDWLEANVSGFWTDVEDDIFSVSPTGILGLFFQNVGRTRRRGVEVGLRGWAGDRVEAYTNYAFTQATFEQRAELATPLGGSETVRPGNLFSLSPEHRVNAGLAYHPRRWATLSLDFGWVGRQFLRGDEANRQPPLAGYTFVNLGASATWRKLTGFVRLQNVLDQAYETFGTFAPNGRVAGTPIERFLTPAAPISAIAGLQYAF